MTDDGIKITVDQMLTNPVAITNRILAMFEEHDLMSQMFPLPKLTRRYRLLRRVEMYREWLAFKIAPWLDDD